jgi:glycosyltransferase involved in cell wall biosynthesis
LLRDSLLKSGISNYKIISLSRNFGAWTAVRAGLAASDGNVTATMAADLQEPMELYLDFYTTLQSSKDAQIAIGVRKERDDPLTQRIFANLFWYLYRVIVNRSIPRGGVDVFALTKVSLVQLNRYTESGTSVIGLLYEIGFDKAHCVYSRSERLVGKSAWTLRKRINYLLDSVIAFSDFPLRVIVLLGTVSTLVFSTAGLVLIVGRLTDAIVVPGYTSLMLAIFFVCSVIVLSLGIIGSVIWRTYLGSKNRPNWIVKQELIVDKKAK